MDAKRFFEGVVNSLRRIVTKEMAHVGDWTSEPLYIHLSKYCSHRAVFCPAAAWKR